MFNEHNYKALEESGNDVKRGTILALVGYTELNHEMSSRSVRCLVEIQSGHLLRTSQALLSPITWSVSNNQRTHKRYHCVSLAFRSSY
jgi:hypothetical protein